jgi:hypothetical protein
LSRIELSRTKCPWQCRYHACSLFTTSDDSTYLSQFQPHSLAAAADQGPKIYSPIPGCELCPKVPDRERDRPIIAKQRGHRITVEDIDLLCVLPCDDRRFLSVQYSRTSTGIETIRFRPSQTPPFSINASDMATAKVAKIWGNVLQDLGIDVKMAFGG